MRLKIRVQARGFFLASLGLRWRSASNAFGVRSNMRPFTAPRTGSFPPPAERRVAESWRRMQSE
jgi:hypothetical protein